MNEQIKDLIQKIQQEGVASAQEQAREIRKEAIEKAAQIIAQAEAEANRVVTNAKEEAQKIEANTKTMLAQARRDMLLALRKEILSMLEKLVVEDIRRALTPEELVKLIGMLVKESCAKAEGDIRLELTREDCEKISKGFIERLKAEAKKGIVLRPAQDVRGGFIISYDSGKSQYDFSDKALAEYLLAYLKPALKELLGE